jgi:hypothetical protein
MWIELTHEQRIFFADDTAGCATLIYKLIKPSTLRLRDSIEILIGA